MEGRQRSGAAVEEVGAGTCRLLQQHLLSCHGAIEGGSRRRSRRTEHAGIATRVQRLLALHEQGGLSVESVQR